MHQFKVWAPKVESIAAKIGDRLYPMSKDERDWWKVDVDEAGAGTDYGFVLDGEEPAIPDPRSAFQPQGVNGLSRVVDHAAFAWKDAGWQAPPLSTAIIYELHVGTFTPEGTFDAVAGKLAYLKELGITHVELLPVNEFPGKHGWGYDGVDLFAPHAAYGDPDALKRLVDAAHAQGLAVIMDVVYNHFGPAGNYVGKYGPYFTDLHKTPWGDAVNLEDAGSHEVRRFFCDNALMWLRDYHVDGLRLDAVTAYMDRSAIHFLEQLATEVDTLTTETGCHYFLIAESDLNDPRIIRPREAGGYGIDAQWSDDFHHALVTILTGDRSGYYEDFGEYALLAKTLEHAYAYDGIYSGFRNRVHGRPATGLPGWRFLGYSQNHDQIGNRAKGERLEHLTSPAHAKIAAALTLTAPFIPMLFQGEEWAATSPFQYFTDHEDKELAGLVSEGRKKEFAGIISETDEVPDPQDLSTFENSRLKWEEVSQEKHQDMLAWYKELIALRKARPELRDGALEMADVEFDEDDQWLSMQRGGIVALFTLSQEGYEAELEDGVSLLLASDAGVTLKDGQLRLSGPGVAILAVE